MLPPKIWEEDVWNNNGTLYRGQLLSIKEKNTYYTTKYIGGCVPYWFAAQLLNAGESFETFDPVNKVTFDVFLIHFQYRKKTGNLIIEVATLHQNYGSNSWQCRANPFSLVPM